MELLLIVIVSLTVLSGLDAHLWPQQKRQTKRGWLRRLAQQRGGERRRAAAE